MTFVDSQSDVLSPIKSIVNSCKKDPIVTTKCTHLFRCGHQFNSKTASTFFNEPGWKQVTQTWHSLLVHEKKVIQICYWGSLACDAIMYRFQNKEPSHQNSLTTLAKVKYFKFFSSLLKWSWEKGAWQIACFDGQHWGRRLAMQLIWSRDVPRTGARKNSVISKVIHVICIFLFLKSCSRGAFKNNYQLHRPINYCFLGGNWSVLFIHKKLKLTRSGSKDCWFGHF